MSLDEKQVINTIKSVAKKICSVNNELKPESDFSNNIIFPLKRQKKDIIRISEQELRLLFCCELFEENVYFSVETPTKYKYRLRKDYNNHSVYFDNNSGQSASIDTTIFNYDKTRNQFERMFNIEFKHKGNLREISKDILKLFAEDENAFFIHLLKNSNKGTFTNENGKCLFKKYVDAISHYKNQWNKNSDSKFVVFSFIVLKKRFLLYKKFKKTDLNNIESFFYDKLEKTDEKAFQKVGWELLKIK